MFGAQVCSVVRWLFGCALVGLLVVLIVPLLLWFLTIMMPGLCCFLRVTRQTQSGIGHGSDSAHMATRTARSLVCVLIPDSTGGATAAEILQTFLQWFLQRFQSTIRIWLLAI